MAKDSDVGVCRCCDARQAGWGAILVEIFVDATWAAMDKQYSLAMHRKTRVGQ